VNDSLLVDGMHGNNKAYWKVGQKEYRKAKVKGTESYTVVCSRRIIYYPDNRLNIRIIRIPDTNMASFPA